MNQTKAWVDVYDLFLPEDISWAPFRALKRIASIPYTNPASEGIRKVRLTLSENPQRALGLFMGVFLSLKPLLKYLIEPQLCYTLASPKILFSQSHKSQFSLSPRPEKTRGIPKAAKGDSLELCLLPCPPHRWQDHILSCKHRGV